MVTPHRISFGQNREATEHCFRHTDRLGLDRAATMAAIRLDLRAFLRSAWPGPNALVRRNVVVGARMLTYHAFTLANGVVNVGRITSGRDTGAPPA